MAQSEPSCLIIEDNVELLAQQKRIFELAGVAVPSAGTANRARNRLLSYPLRVVSFDLQLLDTAGELRERVGLELLERWLPPLARGLVYTGFRSTESGLSAIDLGGRGEFWVLSKGAQNAVELRTARATPLGWSALLLHLMGQPLPQAWGGLRDEAIAFVRELKAVKPEASEPWHRSYWRLAARLLPQPLAEAAARYRAALLLGHANEPPRVGREGVLALNDFREWTVWLARAQTAVILRHQALLRIGPRTVDGLSAAQVWLSEQLPALHALPPEAPGGVAWKHHLGIYAQPQTQRGRTFHSTALDALEELRRVRNDGVHGLKPRERLESDLTMLPDIMDAASFWANNPLLADVRRERGQWRAKILGGKESTDRLLPNDLNVPGGTVDRSHIYQLVWRFTGDGPPDSDEWDRLGQAVPVLLDWWPYLRWTFNSESSADEPLLLTFADSGGQKRWNAQGFFGSVRKPELAPEEISALTVAPV